jgi:ketosteroid isomerase-like protein
VYRQDAIAFTQKVFSHLNQRDYQRAAQYFADDVTLTGAEPAVLAGRDAVIGHFRQSDAALAVADVLASETKVGVQLVLTGIHTGSFDMGPGEGAVPATGKHAAIPVFWVMTLENGLITSVTHY